MFDLLREWWLAEATGPVGLFAARIGSAAFAVVGALVWFQVARTPVMEKSWRPRDVRTFRVLAWLLCLGCLASGLYFLAAGVFEAERTSSPYRLLIANAIRAVEQGVLILLGVFLRFVYARKVAWKAAEMGVLRKSA